jgi:fumarate reductase subunit D
MAKSNETQDEKIFAVISYLWILCFIPLLMKKGNKFIMFHAKQGLVLFICSLAVWIIGIVPFIGGLIGLLGSLLWGIISIIGMVQALMGNSWEIPLLGEYAKKISL